MKKIDTYVLGMIQTNTYVLWNDNHVLLIDPASKSKKLQEALDQANAIVDGIVLTHGHFDHIAGVDTFAKKYGCNVYIHEYDAAMLTDPKLNLSFWDQELVVKTKPILIQDEMKIGTFDVKFILGSGHSEGSVMMLWDDCLFCGDVIFKGSIGRVDFPTSSNTKMYQTLQMIKTMDPNLKVFPGHGEHTTLLEEFKHNPYLAY